MPKNNSDKFELFETADSLHSSEYKHIVLGLIFSNIFLTFSQEQKEKIKEMVTNPDSDFFISENLSDINDQDLEDRDYFTQDNVFWVPESARWETLRDQAKQPDIGPLLIVRWEILNLRTNHSEEKLDKRFGRTQLPEGKLGELIDLISTIGFSDNQKAGDMFEKSMNTS